MDPGPCVQDLPDEVLERVLSFMPPRDLAAAAVVSRHWRVLCQRERLCCAVCLGSQSDKRQPYDKVDPEGTTRPPGYAENQPWREIWMAELRSPEFDCVHNWGPRAAQHSEPCTDYCLLCGRPRPMTVANRITKIVLVGSCKTGKTAIVDHFCRGIQPEAEHEYKATIGIDFGIRHCCMKGEELTLQLWDTSGDERYRVLTNAYFRGTRGVIITFDVSNRDSLHSASSTHWENLIQERIRRQDGDDRDVSVVLLGANFGVGTERKREVSAAEAWEVVRRMNQLPCCIDIGLRVIKYIEANPVTGEGVHRAMAALAGAFLDCSRDCDRADSIVVPPPTSACATLRQECVVM